MQLFNDGVKTYILTGKGNVRKQDVLAVVESGKEQIMQRLVELWNEEHIKNNN
jgi:hypothetical protein